MSELIISVSGLRGIVGTDLTKEVAVRYAEAFTRDLPDGPVVVARDSRASGPMLAGAVRTAIVGAGREAIDAGIAATPTAGVLVQQYKAAGGIQISASHNPPQYNGLKLFSSAGRVIPASDGERVREHFARHETDWKQADQVGVIHGCDDPHNEHLKRVLKVVDVRRIKDRRFKVLLDANHGAGGLLGRKLLEALGCEIVILGEPADGQFEHPPEPTAENLHGVCKSVRDQGAAIGFCQDPDADRLAVIDEQGRYVGEEATLAMYADHFLSKTPGPVVTNCSTSRMTEDLATKYNVPFYRSKVGEANVVDMMLEHKAVLGGEGNGGVIDPRIVSVRDSFVAMAMLLDAMADRDQPISQLADALPQYAIEKTKFTLAADKLSAAYAALEEHFGDATADRLDGLRLDWPGRWLLIRPSNTEPIVRVIAECEDAEVARRICAEAGEVVRGC
ncbi:MAG: phosphoglucosamine mutase [Pirellulales bacterium]|nr:phosphoglucosamine mutase [Pirellulales bacterium]